MTSQLHRIVVLAFGLLVPIAALLQLIMPMAFDAGPPSNALQLGFGFSPLVYIGLYVASVLGVKQARGRGASYGKVLMRAFLPGLGIAFLVLCLSLGFGGGTPPK